MADQEFKLVRKVVIYEVDGEEAEGQDGML
jgi:hypothetical protein